MTGTLREVEIDRFIGLYKQSRRRLRRGEYPSPDDLSRMSVEQFDRYIEGIGFAQRIRDSLARARAADRMGRA